MKQTTAPIKTPSPSRGRQPKSTASLKDNPSMEFIAAALNMSWQLAIVVLVPILVGSQLDKKLELTPTMSILGFIIAMVGTGYIMFKQMQMYDPDSPSRTGGKK